MSKSVSFILKLLILIVLFLWIVVVFIDCFRVHQNKNPLFCVHEIEKNLNDGYIYECTGLGYKVRRYDLDCFSAYEFGPFFIKEKSCN